MTDAVLAAAPARRSKPIGADLYERMLAAGSVILFACVVLAVVRGQDEWDRIPAIIWAHLASIMLALGLTPAMLLRPRGDRLHRQIGWVWASAMVLTAFLSLFVRFSNHGHFSLIHILSVYTLLQVPLLVWFARTHNVVRHRRAVRAMVTGALLIAGFFTFPFGRLLGHWLFG